MRTKWWYIRRGVRGHPGTALLLLWTVVAWVATGDWGAGALMLAVFGPIWVYGAYKRGKANYRAAPPEGEEVGDHE